MKAAPKSQRAMYDEASRKIAEINETFLEMLPTMRRRDLERLIERRPALWGRFAGYLTSGHVFVDDLSTKTQHHAAKKSPAQLDHEIVEVLRRPPSSSKSAKWSHAPKSEQLKWHVTSTPRLWRGVGRRGWYEINQIWARQNRFFLTWDGDPHGREYSSLREAKAAANEIDKLPT